MSNSCPFPKSSMVTDILVDCETNVLTVIQTSPAGTEHAQSVDMSCLVASIQNSRITDAVYDCDNDQLVITQTTEGACNGPDCVEIFTVDMACIRDGLMASCDNITSVTPSPVDSELMVCTPGGVFKTEISAIITQLDCGLLPPVCCPRPPAAEFIVCNDGELSRLPAADVFTCDDIPAAASLATNPTVVVCGDNGMRKVPVSEVQPVCADFPIQDPPPADYDLLACDGNSFISVPKVVVRDTVVLGGEAIDVSLIAGADTDTYTVALVLNDLTTSTYGDLSTPGPVYMAVTANGLNYKIPYVEAGAGSTFADGVGTSLSGDGSGGDPYVIDLALTELTSNVTYDQTAEIAGHLVGADMTMPAIKAGTNVTIDSDGTLHAAGTPLSTDNFTVIAGAPDQFGITGGTASAFMHMSQVVYGTPQFDVNNDAVIQNPGRYLITGQIVMWHASTPAAGGNLTFIIGGGTNATRAMYNRHQLDRGALADDRVTIPFSGIVNLDALDTITINVGLDDTAGTLNLEHAVAQSDQPYTRMSVEYLGPKVA